MKHVIDTNVLIAANGAGEQISPQLALLAAKFLLEVKAGGQVVIDDGLLAISEYKRYMQFAGEPGIGDSFFRWLMTSYGGDHVIRATVEPPGVEHFIPESLRQFDESDKKWIAIYRAGGANDIVNATDSDWVEARDALEAAGIVVRELDT